MLQLWLKNAKLNIKLNTEVLSNNQIILSPTQVDYISVKENKRLLFKSSESDTGQRQWTARRVNP